MTHQSTNDLALSRSNAPLRENKNVMEKERAKELRKSTIYLAFRYSFSPNAPQILSLRARDYRSLKLNKYSLNKYSLSFETITLDNSLKIMYAQW